MANLPVIAEVSSAESTLGRLACHALQLSWPAPSETFAYSLSANEVHLWSFHLDLELEKIRQLRSLLSPAEQARAERFHFARDQDRFIAGRAQLRILLARYLGAHPRFLDFLYGGHGKPALASPWRRFGLHFNLSHCENLAIAAIAAQECGVDVERVRAMPDQEDLVARFFSLRETKQFQALTQEEKPKAFFNLWTRKEAWLKAIGEGIGYALDKVEVSFSEDEPAQILALPPGTQHGAHWDLVSVEPASEFVAALALAGHAGSVMKRSLKLEVL